MFRIQCQRSWPHTKPKLGIWQPKVSQLHLVARDVITLLMPLLVDQKGSGPMRASMGARGKAFKSA